jgi:hypothetical protein
MPSSKQSTGRDMIRPASPSDEVLRFSRVWKKKSR